MTTDNLIPSLDVIYEGYTNKHTTADEMIAWVERVAHREYGVSESTFLSWADRDRQVMYARCARDGDPIVEDEITYWRMAIDNILSRNQWEDVRVIDQDTE